MSRWGIKRPTYQSEEENIKLLSQSKNFIERDRTFNLLQQIQPVSEAKRLAILNTGTMPLQRQSFLRYDNMQLEQKKKQIEDAFIQQQIQNKIQMDQEVAAKTVTMEKLLQMKHMKNHIPETEIPPLVLLNEREDKIQNQTARREFSIQTLNHNRM